MANRLKMAKVQAILTLHRQGLTNRKIGRITGIHRETVGKYIKEENSKPAKAPIGSNGESFGKAVASGSRSECEPYREFIEERLEMGLSAQRIHRDLGEEIGGKSPSYHSVRRFVAKLRKKQNLPYRRMEVEPGEEAQIDFGTAAPVIDRDGKRRRPWVLRVVLSHSRKGWQQIAMHAKAEPGAFRTCREHIPMEKVSCVERGADSYLRSIARIGPHTRQWSEALVQALGIESIRVLAGMKSLAKKNDYSRLERACKVALSHGAYRLRTIRELLKRDDSQCQGQFEFIEEHPIIRPLADYSLKSLHEFRRNQYNESDAD